MAALIGIPAFVLACGVALAVNEWLALSGFYPA